MKKFCAAIVAGATLLGLNISEAQAASKDLSVGLRTQERDNWCWVACDQMILNYNKRSFEEQCEIAELQRSGDTGTLGTTPCCLDPEPPGTTTASARCNKSYALSGITNVLSYHNIGSSTNGRLSYAQVKTQVGNGNPFVVRWGWTKGGGHVIVGFGYNDASGTLKDRVHVNDPWPGEGTKWLDYTAVVTPSGGSWTNTITTAAANTANDQVTLYDYPAYFYLGGSMSTGSTTYVGDGMNDRTSSAKVRGVPYILYQDSNYGGTGWPVTPMDYPSSSNWYGPDNAVSSVLKLPYSDQSIAMLLFENENYTGAYKYVNYFGDGNLHASGWGDRVSSIIVVGGLFQLYSDASWGGLPYAVTSFGGPNRNGFYPNPASWGGPNDDISSLEFLEEYTNPIIVYADGDLTGRAVALRSTSSPSWLNDFRNFGFNDTVSSIKTYGDTWTVYADGNQGGAAHQLGSHSWMRSSTYWGGANDEISSVSYSKTGASF